MRVPGQDLVVFLGSMGNLYFYDSGTLELKGVTTGSYLDGNLRPIAGLYPNMDTRTGTPVTSDIRDLWYAVSAQRIMAISFATKNRVVAANTNGAVYSWDLPPAKPIVGPQLNPDIEAMAITADAGTIAISLKSKAGIHIVDAVTRATSRILPAFSDPARVLAYSPNAEWLAGAAADGTIRLWATRDWQEKATLNARPDAVMSLAFSRDSSLLASGGEDHVIRLWETKSCLRASTISGHTQAVGVVVFGANNSVLASASPSDASVILCDLGAAVNRSDLRGHAGPIRGLAFSPDGSSLIGVSDEVICQWDPTSGMFIRRLAERGVPLPVDRQRSESVRFEDTLTSAAYSPDGAFVVCGGFNNTLLLWEAANLTNPFCMTFPNQKASSSVSSPGTAQASQNGAQKRDFNGSWSLNTNKSGSALGARPRFMPNDALTIRLTATEVKFTLAVAPPDLREEDYLLDGNSHAHNVRGAELPCRAYRKNEAWLSRMPRGAAYKELGSILCLRMV